MNDSFAVYVMHFVFISLISHLTYIILPKNAFMFIPNFILTCFLSLVIIHTFCYFMRKYCKILSEYLFGER